jgi:pimeloyl-ACP methyl ester carboxylesterase
MIRPGLILLFLVSFAVNAQSNKTVVYFFHGQGADKRLFDSIQLSDSFEMRCINYGTPERGSTMNSFARELAKQIDTTQKFVLVGTSLGGMLCAEMSEFLHPEKTILISSAANRKELPFRYRFQRIIPLYFIVPGFVMKGSARILQPIVEPDRKHNKATFKSMLKAKNGKYMRRTIRMIILWKRKENSAKIIRIHGDNDHTLPIRNVEHVDYKVENGSHMITLTRGHEISALLTKELVKK